MKPTLVQQVVDPDGRVTDELDPEVQSEVVSEETAGARRHDDQRGRRGNSIGSAALGGGSTFAGKTGTAEINIEQDIAPGLVHRLRARSTTRRSRSP